MNHILWISQNRPGDSLFLIYSAWFSALFIFRYSPITPLQYLTFPLCIMSLLPCTLLSHLTVLYSIFVLHLIFYPYFHKFLIIRTPIFVVYCVCALLYPCVLYFLIIFVLISMVLFLYICTSHSYSFLALFTIMP